MKKVLSLVLVALLGLTLLFGVVGCSGKEEPANNNQTEINETEGETETNNEADTGNTETNTAE